MAQVNTLAVHITVSHFYCACTTTRLRLPGNLCSLFYNDLFIRFRRHENMPADSQYELVPLASQNEDIGQRDSNEDFQSTSESEPHENPKLSSRFDNITTSIFTFCAVVFAAVFFWRTFPSKMMEDDPSLARTANGTYRGLHSVERDQYLFLGMPYALPPVGTLRFAAPRHIESSWQDIRTAQAYGPHCLGYGVSVQKRRGLRCNIRREKGLEISAC